MSDDTILRLAEVMSMVGLRRTTIWTRVRQGTFPIAVQLGGNRIGWRQSEIQRWIDERPLSQPGPSALRAKAAALKHAAPPSVSTPPIGTASPPAAQKPKLSKVLKSARRDLTDQGSFSFD